MHGNHGITRQKAFLAALPQPHCIPTPHYRELPQAPTPGGHFAHQLICSTLSHQVPFYLPLPAQNYSTSSTELFISLRGCHGARRYGSQRPRKHLFAQSPDGFLKNCFPCSAAGNSSHSSATTHWRSLFVPEQCCQSPTGWKGQLRAPRPRPLHSEAPGRAVGSVWVGHFPGTPPASSFLSFWGAFWLLWQCPLPARGPGCSQASPLRPRGCDWGSLLLRPLLLSLPAPAAAPTFPEDSLGQHPALPSRPRARGIFKPVPPAPFPSSPCLSPPCSSLSSPAASSELSPSPAASHTRLQPEAAAAAKPQPEHSPAGKVTTEREQIRPCRC